MREEGRRRWYGADLRGWHGGIALKPGFELGSDASVVVRGLIALVLVVSFVIYPWQVSGPISYNSADPHLIYVTPTPTGGVEFNQAADQVNISASQTGGPRADLVTSESSYSFASDIAIKHQQLSPMGHWYWVSSTSPVPWGAAQFKVRVQSGNNTITDISSIRIVSQDGASIFQTDFSANGSSGWNLEGATFDVVGSKPLPAIRLASNTTLATAETSNYTSVSSSVTTIMVEALIQFEGNGGPFKVETQWYNSGRSLIIDETGYNSWSSYIDIPAALVFRVWYPAAQQDVRIRFEVGDNTHGQIFLEIISQGFLAENRTIASYVLGESFHLAMEWAKPSSISLHLTNATSSVLSWSSLDAPIDLHLENLASQSQMDLSVSAQTFNSTASLQDPLYVFPGSGRFVSFSENSWPLAYATALLGVLVVLWVPEERKIVSVFKAKVPGWGPSSFYRVIRDHWFVLAALVLGGSFYGYLALSFGGHPFDSITFRTWTYAGQVEGLRGIWGRATSATDSYVRGGNFPWSSISFAYLPLGSYFILALSAFVPSISSFANQGAIFSSNVLHAEIKWGLGFPTFVTSAVMYWLVLKGTGSRRRALIASVLIMSNPAITFDSAIWGETDSVLYLVFTLFAWVAGRRPGLSLMILLLGIDFKQTGIILLLPVALMFLVPRRKLVAWLSALSKSASVLFVSLFPLLLSGILPSTLYKPFFAKLADIGTPLGNQSPGITPDTYNAWTTFTGPFGLIQYPANIPVVGPVSFSIIGLASFAALSIYLLLRLRKARLEDPAFWFAFVAASSIAFNVVLTGGASRYYTLAIPPLVGMIALGWDRFSKMEQKMAALTLTLVSLVAAWTMAGLFTWIMSWEFPDIHGLELNQNPIMAFVRVYYDNNIVITLGSIAALAMLYLSVRLSLSLALHNGSKVLEGSAYRSTESQTPKCSRK